MARLPGLLKRTSKAEELALEEARQGSIARLERLLAHRAGIAIDDDSVQDEVALDDDATAEPAEPVEPGELAQGTAVPYPGYGPVQAGREQDADAAPTLERTAAGVPVMAPAAIDVTRHRAGSRRPSAVVIEVDWDDVRDVIEPDGVTDDAAAANAEPDMTQAVPRMPDGTTGAQDLDIPLDPGHVIDAAPTREPLTASDGAGTADPAPERRAPVRQPRPRAARAVEAATAVAADSAAPPVEHRPVVPPPPPRVGGKAVPVHPKRRKRQPRLPAVLAACPSCAVLLDPRPTTSKRCTRCRERIVVKRVEGGVLYLTAAAAGALEEAQRTVKVWARLARSRNRWLAQAAAVGAPSQRIERVARPMPSEEQVTAARDLYFATAGRAFAAARRERRFAEAAAIRRAHAQALYREFGSPSPVPEAVALLHRDAMAAELRAARDVGRDAELLTTCCDPCRQDAGIIVRISDELRGARLPHATCEQGLCRCRWSPARTGGRRPASRGSAR